MADKGLHGNGTWKTIALMSLTGLDTLGVMTIYYGERIASLETRVDMGFKNVDKAINRFDRHIFNEMKGTQ